MIPRISESLNDPKDFCNVYPKISVKFTRKFLWSLNDPEDFLLSLNDPKDFCVV